MQQYREETGKIKELLKANPRGLSVTDISKNIGINRNTVAKYLEILRISGHVEMDSIGTAKVYFLSQRIPVSTLLDFSSDYIIVLDNKCRVVQTNDKFADIAGIPKKEIIGASIDEILPPMISNRTLLEKINLAMKGDELVEMLDIIINNELCFLKTKIIPSTFEDGDSGVTLIMENITEDINHRNSLKEEQEKLEKLVSERTYELERSNEMLKNEIIERKIAEEKLQEEYSKTQNYLNVAGVLIIVIDNNARITLINKKGLEILECKKEDVIGKNFIDTFIIEPEREEAYEICRKLMKGSEEIYCEHNIVTPSGKVKLTKWTNVSLKDKNESIIGAIGSAQDITEQRTIEEKLRESEKKYRLLAENTLDSIWEMDENLVFTYANHATIDIIDFGPEGIVGTRLQDHFPEPEVNRMIKIMTGHMKSSSGNEFKRMETVMYDRERNLVPIEIYARMVVDETGTFRGLQGTTRRSADKTND
ncbi:PAS domain S-box protein [Methanolobus sp. WCC4]|uniref:PAS domain S-box protein n=1 Tax=Methanolobus sp. WCC4 TaxID=3125784 RepID=UPI0030F51B27